MKKRKLKRQLKELRLTVKHTIASARRTNERLAELIDSLRQTQEISTANDNEQPKLSWGKEAS